VAAPRGVVEVREVGRGAVVVGVVTGGEHGARDAVEQRRRLVVTRSAVGDVARPDQHRIRSSGVRSALAAVLGAGALAVGAGATGAPSTRPSTTTHATTAIMGEWVRTEIKTTPTRP
jgi:hypothetical protein